MTRSTLTFRTYSTRSHRDLATRAEGREDQPPAAALIGGRLH